MVSIYIDLNVKLCITFNYNLISCLLMFIKYNELKSKKKLPSTTKYINFHIIVIFIKKTLFITHNLQDL